MRVFGCTTRSYAFDADSNRTRMVTRAPGGGGACDTSGAGSVSDHTYDAGDRITDSGYTYDSFGRVTQVPGRDAGGQDLSATYYQNDLVHSLTQNGVTLRNLLDPLRRVRVRQIPGQFDKPDETFHYQDDSDSPAWSAQGTHWQRYIEGIGGDLAAVQDSQAGVELQLANLHGDVVATASLDVNATKPLATFESTEFGAPRQQDVQAPGRRYDWLGQKQRRSDLPSGIVEMGVRVYVPQIGRFLQPDPVPGGSANDYDYVNQDPTGQFDLSGTDPCSGKKRNRCVRGVWRNGVSPRKLTRLRRRADRAAGRKRSLERYGGNFAVKRISSKILKPLGAYNAAADCSEVRCRSQDHLGGGVSPKDVADAACVAAGTGGGIAALAQLLGKAAVTSKGVLTVFVGCAGYGAYAYFRDH